MVKQYDEGAKSVVAALTMGALASMGVRQLSDLLFDRYPTKQERDRVLDELDKKTKNTNYEDKVDQLEDFVKKQEPVLVKPKKALLVKPNVVIEDDNTTNLVNFVKHYEQFHPKRYWDYKQWSIGYGSKAKEGEKEISHKEAISRLQNDLTKRRKMISDFGKRHGYKWTPHQIDALTSFHYNIGTIIELTQNGMRSNDEITEMMSLYTKAGGKTLQGLVDRRAAEQDLFLSGYDSNKIANK